jgi:hypothetical protein
MTPAFSRNIHTGLALAFKLKRQLGALFQVID